MKNGLSRYGGILLVGIFVLSIFSIWLYEVNCGEGGGGSPPTPPPCTVCCKCPADKPNCCGNECCAQANCCGNQCHASAQYPCGTACCDVPDTGSYGCCGNIPCCAGECCVKVTESPDPESDSGGVTYQYDYNCCSGGQKCCGGTCVSNLCGNSCPCSTGQRCCNGLCCYKNWTKQDIPAGEIPCTACNGGACSGSKAEWNSFALCQDAGNGQGEHCVCTSDLRTIGYEYNCIAYYDDAAIVGCWLCTAFCELGADELCLVCLIANSDYCCDGCEPCHWVQKCDKSWYEHEIPIAVWNRLVFWNFGC